MEKKTPQKNICVALSLFLSVDSCVVAGQDSGVAPADELPNLRSHQLSFSEARRRFITPQVPRTSAHTWHHVEFSTRSAAETQYLTKYLWSRF